MKKSYETFRRNFENAKRIWNLEEDWITPVEYLPYIDALLGDIDLDQKQIKNKVSSVLISDDKPGSLLQSLNIFSELDINLTKLESRPILGRPWEYKFYIDYELENLEKQSELEEKISKVSKEFKLLGHYPKAIQ